MDVVRFTMLRCRYFIAPDYLVVHRWTRDMLLSPNNTILAWLIIYTYINFFTEVFRHFQNGTYVVPYHLVVADFRCD